MDDRKRITLIYQYNDNWIGGTYYILNIVKSLNYLPDAEKPFVILIHDRGSSTTLIEQVRYPYINFLPVDLSLSLPQKVFNKFSKAIIKQLGYKVKVPSNIENLYPVSDLIDIKDVKCFYYWLPDFQEHFYPNFFSNSEIKERIRVQRNIVNSQKPIIFSSYTALEDFDTLYPGNQNLKKVLQFASVLDESFKSENISHLLSKFNITQPYFIVSNQFWRHKNHLVVLEAAKILKSRNINFELVFTGKEHDYRDPTYIKKLRSFVSDHNLNEITHFLGFIDRNEQLQLANHSLAIIQPSLFEGWSTVVEDAKALNHLIILSDIRLHKEQIQHNCLFFAPHDANMLAEKMIEAADGITIQKQDYRENISKFAKTFVDLF